MTKQESNKKSVQFQTESDRTLQDLMNHKGPKDKKKLYKTLHDQTEKKDNP